MIQAAEREAGYILLGALALALPAGQVAAQRAELLELWRVALAPDAAAELDVKKYLQVCSGMSLPKESRSLMLHTGAFL